MSTSAYIYYEEGFEATGLAETLEHLGLSLKPGDFKNIGDQIEVTLLPDGKTLIFSTFFMGENRHRVRELAMECWELHGGSLAMSLELRRPPVEA